jgi:hypothetical protein
MVSPARQGKSFPWQKTITEPSLHPTGDTLLWNSKRKKTKQTTYRNSVTASLVCTVMEFLYVASDS